MPVLRPTWTGALRLSLVTIPVRVFAATTAAADVHFHQLHRKCHTPIQLKKWCPHCRREVSNDELVKGFERSKGRFVLIEEEEISRLRPASTRTIDISDLVTLDAIDPVMVERAYFLAPANRAGGATFAVFREALGDRAAVGRVAVHGREYLAAVVKRKRALLMLTLRTKGEMRDADQIGELDFADVKAKAPELKLARQVLDSFRTNADLRNFTDHYEDALKGVLRDKPEVAEPAEAEAGRGRGRGHRRAARSNVVSLMDALRDSLADAKKHQRAHAARARVLKHPAARRRRAG